MIPTRKMAFKIFIIAAAVVLVLSTEIPDSNAGSGRGNCPSGLVRECRQTCVSDSNCPSPKEKCCDNSCAGKSCFLTQGGPG
ncbi:hypothetical protein R5R35_010409 [Gryllus longicercus]|uniref:WAP domain-containing protein n=1 Tax=Gryllus longicercus TaxID=2509291 RepID=A0AAN9VPM6_9ORTH